MRLSNRTKAFLAILPLAAISLVLLITMMLPYRQIPQRLAVMDAAIEQAVLAGQLSRNLDRQLDEFQEFLISGNAEALSSLRGYEATGENLIRRLVSVHAERVGGASEVEKDEFQQITSGYDHFATFKKEGLRLAQANDRTQALKLFHQESEPLVKSLMTNADLFIRRQEGTFNSELPMVVSFLGALPVMFSSSFQQEMEALGQHATLIFKTDLFSREASMLFREYENMVSAGDTSRLAESQYRTRDALVNWEKWCRVNLTKEQRGKSASEECVRLQRAFADAEQSGGNILVAMKMGQRKAAAEGLEKEFSPLEGSFLYQIENFIKDKQGALRSDIRRASGKAGTLKLTVGLLCVLVVAMGLGGPLLLDRALAGGSQPSEGAAERNLRGRLEAELAAHAAELETKNAQLTQEREARQLLEQRLQEHQTQLDLLRQHLTINSPDKTSSLSDATGPAS